MNKIVNIGLTALFACFVAACENDIDNYDAPNGGVYGTIYDKETNEPVPMPVPGSSGVMMSLYEQNTGATASVDFRARQDGTFEHTKVFNGSYRIQAKDGPFVGVCEGYVTVNGQTQVDLYTIPFSRISLDVAVSADNKLTLTYDAKTSNETLQLTDVSVIWNYAPGVDVNNANHATLSSLGTKASGTHVIDLMSDTEFIENHYKIVSNKNRVYVLLLLLAGGLFAGCSSDDDGVTPPDEKDGVLVKVMSYNIYSGQKAYSGKKGMEAIAQVIKKINPDLAGLQEFETKTNKVGKADIIALMKEVTGMPYAFFVKTRDVDGGEYGNLILSKYPISDEVNYDLPRIETVEDVHPRSMGVVKTEKDGKGFYFGVTHLSHVGNETNRINQTTTIIEKTKGLDEPMILTGDFNALADSGPMKILYERFEIGCLNGNYGLTTGTPVPVKAIDFVLYTPDEEMSPKAYDVYYDAYVESDHFPVVATFSIND